MAVTLRDVAAHAGVSAITVSRALNNSGYVSQEVRARVIASATELGYVQNAVASSLRANKTQLIALLAGVINPFWSNVARGIEDTAMEAGYGLIMCDTADEPAKEARYIDLLARRRIDGLIIAATQDSAPILQNLRKSRQPFVLIDRIVEGVDADAVRGNNFGAAYQMTKHLISTGYKRIGMISGAHNVSTAEERVAGYRSALAESGVEAEEDMILYGRFSETWGYEAAQDLMLREHPPQALFAGNNFIALGILECLHTLGLRVPEDVAVVCFDDTTKVESARFLTTASQPAEEMGRIATRVLLELIEKPDKAPVDVILPIDLMIRNSCGCGTTDKTEDRARRGSLQTAL